jgi:hypothetical protein
MIRTPVAATAVPVPVRLSVLGWLTAVTAGVLEALVRIVLPDSPTPGQLAARFAIYAVVVVLVLALRTGRNAIRWVLAVLLGGIGTLSLVVEPLSWLLVGGSPAAFLATADGPTLLIVGLRVAHLIAVFAALVLMFRPRANLFFRRARHSAGPRSFT